MDDFLLKIRLEALQHNLIQIQNIFKSVRARRQDIDKLSKNIEKAGQHLVTVMYNADSIWSSANPAYGASKVDPGLKPFLTLILENGRQLGDTLRNADANIETIRKRWAPIEKVEEMVRQSLDGVTEGWIGKIVKNLEALNDAKAGEAGAVMETAWKDYTDIIAEQMRLFSFSDYVQFLGGVALRDAGLDEGICRIADELISSCGSTGKTDWNALTIPASQEAVTLARSIRMGFPEWTLWAVPLTAHVLGQVAIMGGKNRLESDKSSNDWEEYIFTKFPGKTKKARQERERLLIYLADAFATYVMGPAYACSAILLRFDPLLAYVDGEKYPADAKRAHVILTMLKLMRGQDDDYDPPYSKTVDKLEVGWEASLKRAKPTATGTISAEELKRLEIWSEYMFKELPGEHVKGLYKGTRLVRTRSALERLLNKEELGDSLKDDEEGRDVLNAAWELRVENKYESREIELHAQRLWDLIAEKKLETHPVETPEAKSGVYSRSGEAAISLLRETKHGR